MFKLYLLYPILYKEVSLAWNELLCLHSDVLQCFSDGVRWEWKKITVCIYSLFYNHFLDQGYVADVCMEPMFWFVDNFTKFLGPVSMSKSRVH